MSNDTTPKKNHAINFPTLKLKAGTWLNLRSQGVGVANCQVEYVAALHGRSILVAQPASTTSKRGLLVGDHYLVRGFNGTSEFTFTSEVSALQSEPFAYAHLTYPDLVEVLVVREALRVNVLHSGGRDAGWRDQTHFRYGEKFERHWRHDRVSGASGKRG